MPSPPPPQTWRSSAVAARRRRADAATDDVYTTRSTSARRHSSSTTRVPHVDLEELLGSRGASSRRRGRPASTPLSARRIARRSVTSASRARRRSRRAASSATRRTVTRTSSPRSTSARAICEPTNPVAPVTSVAALPPECTSDTARRPWTGSRSSPTRRIICRANGHADDIHQVSLYVTSRAEDRPRIRHADFAEYYDRLSVAKDMPTRHSRPWATSSRSTSRCRGRRRHRLDPPGGRDLRNMQAAGRRAISWSNGGSTPSA